MTACPSGWRLPTREDWNDLVEAAGGNPGASTKLKSGPPDWDGTDDFGFSALPGGARRLDGSFTHAGIGGGWWSATEDWSGYARSLDMYSNSDYANRGIYDKGFGLSVLCVR